MKKEPMIEIPALFWKTISDAEWQHVCDTGYLSAAMCRKLWHLTDRQDDPPDSVQVLISSKDLKRVFPEIKK